MNKVMTKKEYDDNNFKKRILDEMKTDSCVIKSRLPRETELADHMKVSRTQLRDAMANLERPYSFTARIAFPTKTSVTAFWNEAAISA